MRTNYTLLFLLILIHVSSYAYKIGDYRNATRIDTVGEWNNINAWEIFNGTAWETPTVPPGSTNTVYITEEHAFRTVPNITIDSLILEKYVFNVSDSITILGSLIIRNGGTFRLASNGANSNGAINIEVKGDLSIGENSSLTNDNFTPKGKMIIGGDIVNNNIFKPFRYGNSEYDLTLGGLIKGTSESGIENIDTLFLEKSGKINIEQDLIANTLIFSNADTLDLRENDLLMVGKTDTNYIVGKVLICDTLQIDAARTFTGGFHLNGDVICNYFEMNNIGGGFKNVNLNGYDLTIKQQFVDRGSQSNKFSISGDSNSVINFGDGDLGSGYHMDIEFKQELRLRKLVMKSATDTLNFKGGTVEIDTLIIYAGEVTGSFNAKYIKVINDDAQIKSVSEGILKNDTIVISAGVTTDSLIKLINLSNPAATFVIQNGSNTITSGPLDEAFKIIVTSTDLTKDSTYSISLLGADATIDSVPSTTISNDTIYLTTMKSVEELIPIISLSDSFATFKVNDGQNEVNTGALTNDFTIIVTAEDGVTQKTYFLNIDLIVALNEFYKISKPSFYPNPANQFIMISPQVDQLLVYDLKGVEYLNINDVEGLVDVSQLPKGIYVIKLVDSTHTFERKLTLR